MLSPATTIEGYDALDMPTAIALAYVRDQRSPSTLPGLSDRPGADAARRTLLVVDAACDMPQSWLDYHGVVVAPRRVPLATGELTESREPRFIAAQLAKLDAIGATAVQTLPCSPVVLRDLAHRHLRKGTSGVVVLTVSARRSKFYSYAIAAVQSLVLIHTKVRRTLDPSAAPLRAWVIDSTNALTGCGVLLAEAVRLRESHAPSATIAQALNDFRPLVHTLVVPGRFHYLARAARTVELAPIPIWKQQLAELFDRVPLLHLQADQIHATEKHRRGPRALAAALRHCMRALEQGALATPTIAVSYVGPMEDIEALRELSALRAQCTRQQVTLCVSPMSLTGALMLGPGALSVSFASRAWRP